MMTIQIATLVLLIGLSAFFSSAEVAFLALSDAKVHTMVKRQSTNAKLIQAITRNRRRLLITVLVGNNIVNIAASSLATVIVAQFFDSAVIGLTTGIMTLLVLIFGEIMPKSYASNHPKRFATLTVRWLRLFQILSYPIVIVFEWLTNTVAGKHTDDFVSEEELRALAQASLRQGAIEQTEGTMIERLFAFNDITAEDIMSPRVHVVFISDATSIEAATEIVKNNPFTRYPVIESSVDHIVGYVHSRDILLAHHRDQVEKPIRDIMLPIMAVPKQMPIDEVMKEFQKRRTHMAVVVDEYGGTEGIVTFEDIIEELVGEIADEHDIQENLIQRIDDHSVFASGDTDIRDVNQFLNCAIPGDQFDTIAEVMLDTLQKIPRKGQKIALGDTICTIIEVKKRRIQKVEVKKNT